MILLTLHVSIDKEIVYLALYLYYSHYEGKPWMNKDKEINNISKDLNTYILKLLEENENRMVQISDQKKAYMNDILEKEAFINTVSKSRKESSDIFSPNSKEYITEDYYTELDNIKVKMEDIEKVEDKLNSSKLHLMEILKMMVDLEHPRLNIGINILEIQEQDRQRIARDLHDSTVQNLTSLVHKSELCQRLIDMDPIRTKLELNTMSSTLKAVINEIREIIYNLKPMSLDDLGLVTTIERFANQLMMNHDIKVNVVHNKERQDIIPVIRLSVFRMIQEACNNTIKHANAKTIDIKITYEDKQLIASITDDGKGFEVESKRGYLTPDYSGYGLSIMKERVYLLSGIMKIQSNINKGTNVTITIPITKYEGEE